MPHPQLQHTDSIDNQLNLTKAAVEVGILIFDIEHHEMLDRLHRLCDCITADKPETAVRAEAAGLLAASKRHFDHEEEYMRDLHYADYAIHAEDHRALSGKLERFVDKLFAEGCTADRNITRICVFFRAWLLDHVIEHDRTLANFLMQKGIR